MKPKKTNDIDSSSLIALIEKFIENHDFSDQERNLLAISFYSNSKFEEVIAKLAAKYEIPVRDIIEFSLALRQIQLEPDTQNPLGQDGQHYHEEGLDLEHTKEELLPDEQAKEVDRIFSSNSSWQQLKKVLDDDSCIGIYIDTITGGEWDGAITPDDVITKISAMVWMACGPGDYDPFNEECLKHACIEFLRNKDITVMDWVEKWLPSNFQRTWAALSKHKDCEQYWHSEELTTFFSAFDSFKNNCLNDLFLKFGRTKVTCKTLSAYRKPHFHFVPETGEHTAEGLRLREYRGLFSDNIQTTVEHKFFESITNSIYLAYSSVGWHDDRAQSIVTFDEIEDQLNEYLGIKLDEAEDHEEYKYEKPPSYKIRACLRFFCYTGLIRYQAGQYIYQRDGTGKAFYDEARQCRHKFRKPNYRKELDIIESNRHIGEWESDIESHLESQQDERI